MPKSSSKHLSQFTTLTYHASCCRAHTLFLCNEALLLTQWLHSPLVLPPTTVVYSLCVQLTARFLTQQALLQRLCYVLNYQQLQTYSKLIEMMAKQLMNWYYSLSKSITHMETDFSLAQYFNVICLNIV